MLILLVILSWVVAFALGWIFSFNSYRHPVGPPLPRPTPKPLNEYKGGTNA